VASGQSVQHIETDVVAGALVVSTGVSDPDDELQA
jgi:hypothetical protein